MDAAARAAGGGWAMIKEFIEREAAIDHFCVGGKI